MNDETRKLLTEYLGECQHEKSGTSYFVPHIPGFRDVEDSFLCSMCGQKFRESEYRTFASWQDLGDLKNKLVEKGEWIKFREFTWVVWYDSEPDKYTALDCYESPSNFENWFINATRFCELVGEFIMSTKSENAEMI